MKGSLTQMFLEAEAKEASALKAPEPPKQYLDGVWIVRPGKPIPEEFVDVLKSWDAVKNHPAWKNHSQLT